MANYNTIKLIKINVKNKNKSKKGISGYFLPWKNRRTLLLLHLSPFLSSSNRFLFLFPYLSLSLSLDAIETLLLCIRSNSSSPIPSFLPFQRARTGHRSVFPLSHSATPPIVCLILFRNQSVSLLLLLLRDFHFNPITLNPQILAFPIFRWLLFRID